MCDCVKCEGCPLYDYPMDMREIGGLVAGLTRNDVEEYLREVSELPPDTFAPRGPIA